MCERTQFTLTFPPQIPTLPDFDYFRLGLWPVWSEEHPGGKITVTKPLLSCRSSIIGDCATNTGSWDKCPLFRNLSSHSPPFPMIDMSIAGSGWAPAFFHRRCQLHKGRTQAHESSAVQCAPWTGTGYTVCYHDRVRTESESKHVEICLATWHCQDSQAHYVIFYPLSICNGFFFFMAFCHN